MEVVCGIIEENETYLIAKMCIRDRIHDEYRIEYFRTHIEQMKEAIKDGVELIAYFLSLIHI